MFFLIGIVSHRGLWGETYGFNGSILSIRDGSVPHWLIRSVFTSLFMTALIDSYSFSGCFIYDPPGAILDARIRRVRFFLFARSAILFAFPDLVNRGVTSVSK